jgi:hypothetical protein
MFTFGGKMLLPFMIKLIGILKLKLKLLKLLKLLKIIEIFLYITIVFWNVYQMDCDTSIFELLNNCSELEAMFLPAACDLMMVVYDRNMLWKTLYK